MSSFLLRQELYTDGWIYFMAQLASAKIPLLQLFCLSAICNISRVHRAQRNRRRTITDSRYRGSRDTPTHAPMTTGPKTEERQFGTSATVNIAPRPASSTQRTTAPGIPNHVHNHDQQTGTRTWYQCGWKLFLISDARRTTYCWYSQTAVVTNFSPARSSLDALSAYKLPHPVFRNCESQPVD